MKVIKEYGEIHNDNIASMVVTPDSKFQFTACDRGQLLQWEIKKQRLWRNYEQADTKSIKCMQIIGS